MKSDRHTLRWLIIWSLISVSFLGLALTWIIKWLFFDSEIQMMQHPFWSIVVHAFSLVFIIALMVLTPIQILYFGRKHRGNKPLPKMTAGDIIGMPFGTYNPDAEVPKWIKIPILSFMYILLAILVLGVLLGTIAYIFS